MEALSINDSGNSIYDRLREGHRTVFAMNAEMAAYVSKPMPPAWDVFDDFRWRYSREAVQHLSFKDQHVYLNLLESSAPGAEKLVKELRREQESLHAAIQKHILKWPQSAIRTNWSSYARDSAPLAQRNADLLNLEEDRLHPVVLLWEKSFQTTLPGRVQNWAGNIWAVRDAIMKS